MDLTTHISSYAVALGALGVLSLAAGLAPGFAGEPSMRTRPDANETGIWKSYTPRGVKGEFNNYDPVGLMAGALIKADCSFNWRDPDTRKLYCFASGTSFNYFQDFPKANARKAKDAFEQAQRERPGS